MDIKIEKLNNTYLRLHCDEGIARELADYFCFQVPNFQFHPLFRKRKWDGKKRLFDIRKHTIYYGLLDKIVKFCEDRNYSYEKIDDFDKPTHTMTAADLDAFIKTLNIPNLDPRSYQNDSVRTLINSQRNLLLSPTSSGKSFINYLIVRYLLQADLKKILVIVPRIQLVQQLYADFEEYGWDARSFVHPIFAGQSKIEKFPVYVSTWQSLMDMPSEYFEQFDAVVVDECHEAKAKEISRIMECCINAEYKFGMTGTLDGTETHKIVLEGLFGPVIRFISTRELIDQGYAASLDIRCLVCGYSEIEKKALRKLAVKPKEGYNVQKASMDAYNQELEFIIHNKNRNAFIAELALSRVGNTLVTFQFVEGEKKPHGKLLYEIIQKLNVDNKKKVYFIHGGTDVDIREEIRKLVENNDNCIIVASSGVFAMGINMKNLHHLILASPSKARIKLLQSIGRVLRLHDSKNQAIVYDIADDLRIGKYINFTLKHFEKRVETYNEEGFTYKVHKVNLGG